MTTKGPLRLVKDKDRGRADILLQLRWHLEQASRHAREIGLEAVPFVHEARTAFVATKRRR